MIETAQSTLGVRPADMRRLLAESNIASREAEVLVGEPTLAVFWKNAQEKSPSNARFVLNWLIGDQIKLAETNATTLDESLITPERLVEVSSLLEQGQLSSTNAKALLTGLWVKDGSAKVLASSLGLLQVSDESELKKVVESVIEANPQAVADYRSGNDRAFGSLVGQSMKATQGKGNPPLINKLLREILDSEE